MTTETGNAITFLGWHWNVDSDGYLDVIKENKEILATFPPGRWIVVEDLNPNGDE